MSGTRIKIGVSDCDRMRPLVDGSVTIDGVAADFQLMPVQDLFNKQLTEHTFDCCEFPIATYLRTLDTPERPYVAVPIFPSRHFRLSCVFVNRNAGISRPADLAGRKVGIPVFDMAAAVWLRGIFEEHYGLDRTAPVYVTGGLEHARVGDEHPQFYPAKFKVERATPSLASMLETGDIDCLYTARAPSSFRPGGDVVRLFADPQTEEMKYFERSGIFPPMHILCLKRSVYERMPDVCQRLFAAFLQAQNVARQRIYDSAALSVMLPWLLEHLLETEAMLGSEYWAAGFTKNHATLAKVIQYMRDDALIGTAFEPEDLFADKKLLLT
jgi:4,5-dihydroxyphthalate decarboxylase